jgi:four helix bundle protein
MRLKTRREQLPTLSGSKRFLDFTRNFRAPGPRTGHAELSKTRRLQVRHRIPRLVTETANSIPRGHAAVIDQLKRAAQSVPLNIAEAAGRTGQADAARAYAIARGSAMECAAIFDVLKILQIVDEDRHRRGCSLLERVVAMLTKLCK